MTLSTHDAPELQERLSAAAKERGQTVAEYLRSEVENSAATMMEQLAPKPAPLRTEAGGVVRRVPGLDLVRAQDMGLMQTPDPLVLEEAAREGRIVLTHDVSSMVAAGYERVGAGLPMPGLFAVRQSLPIGQAIEQIVLLL